MTVRGVLLKRPFGALFVDVAEDHSAAERWPDRDRARLRIRSGQKRGVHGQIKKDLRRRSAIEAVIGHCKTEGHLGRNFLKAASATRSTPS